jgi:nucleoside-diphosphate-sugar epimerase
LKHNRELQHESLRHGRNRLYRRIGATRLLERGDTVIGLARSDDAAAALKKRGIEPLMGDINAYTPFVEVAKRVDAVINAANSDNAFVVHALLDGLKGSGKTLIQTSGSSVVGAYDNGEASEDTFDEDTPFTPQPEKAMRVAIDEQVLDAAEDNIRTIVIRPTLIYGRGLGVAATSIQLPKLIDVARKHGVPRHVGRGETSGAMCTSPTSSRSICWRSTRRKPARCSTPRTARRRSRR